jgi:hypothetical protein
MASKKRIDVSTPRGLLDAFESEEAGMRSVRTATYDISKKHSLQSELEHIIKHVRAQIENIQHERPDEATDWRAAQCYVESLQHETAMWIAISNNNASGAWSCFCEAEREALLAVRYLPKYGPAERQLIHIREVERVAFPPQPLFLSSSLIVSPEDVTCGVCGTVYGECDHLAGEIYGGILATKVTNGIDAVREVSFVENPSSKHCRILEVSGVDPLTGVPPKKVARAARRERKKR